MFTDNAIEYEIEPLSENTKDLWREKLVVFDNFGKSKLQKKENIPWFSYELSLRKGEVTVGVVQNNLNTEAMAKIEFQCRDLSKMLALLTFLYELDSDKNAQTEEFSNAQLFWKTKTADSNDEDGS